MQGNHLIQTRRWRCNVMYIKRIVGVSQYSVTFYPPPRLVSDMEPHPHKKFSLRSLRLRFKSTSSIDAQAVRETALERPPPHRTASEPPSAFQSGSHNGFSSSEVYLEPARSSTTDKGLPPIPASQLSSPVSPAAYDQQAAWPLPTTQTPVKTNNSLQMPAPYTPSSSPEVQMPMPQTEELPPAPVPMPIPQVNGFVPSKVDPTTEHQNQGEAQSYYAIETSSSVGGSAVDGLAEIAGKLNDDDDVAQRSRTEKAMGMLEDKADVVNGQVSLVSQVVQPIQALIEATGAVEAIKNGLNSFMEDIPWLMKSLDEVAKIHPVVTAAVLAFKAVYTMEMTRRENDRRIISLHVSMKDMIQILVQLRDIKDPKDVGPDGRTLEARLQSLSDNAAADIKACANACETYIKKRLLVKVLKGKVWESKLIDFIGTFTKRRAEFEFALAIHTAKAVESMKRTVESIDEKVAALTALLRDQFCHFTPENEIELARKVEEKGGVQAVKNNDFLLRELDDFQGGADSGMKKGASSKTGGGSANHATKTESVNERSAQRSTFTLQDLKDELHEDWDTALKENLKTFEGKFALQQRHLEQALSKFIHEENNRLIDEVNKGPHDKIKNEELKMIWKEMSWRRNVKARLFVMTIRDYFSDKASSSTRTGATIEGKDSSSDPQRSDDWAFEYININYLQTIMEAFDDDGSGYVTIMEVNRFIEALPPSLQWSLPQWVAYWAIGWQITSTYYRNKILQLFAHMFAMRPSVLPENRYWVDYYLSKVWKVGVEMTKSLRAPSNVPDNLEGRFKAYVDYEEDRIRKNLEDIRYDIDALDTVYVVAGPGRIEKYIFPLMYLLLKRDIEIFHTAKTQILHNDELWDAAESLLYVYDAVTFRHKDLSALFQQQKLDVDQQMKKFACEIFDYFHNPAILWKMSCLESNVEEDAEGEPEVGQWDSKASVLNYPIQDQHPFKWELYEEKDETPTESDLQASLPLKAILGEWNGFIYTEDTYPLAIMTSFYAHTSTEADEDFQASGFYNAGTYKLSGKCYQDSEGNITVIFTIQFSEEADKQYFIGHLAADGNIIGTQGWDENASGHSYQFILSRLPAETICFRPSPSQFRLNKPRALWKFATRAIRFQVLKKMWSWTYFAERRDLRTRRLELEHRLYYYGRALDEDELADQVRVRQSLTIRDISFYRSIRDYEHRVIPTHTGYMCDACGYGMGGARLVCLDCQPPEAYFYQTVDFCNDPKCYGTTVTSEKREALLEPHVPAHDFLKIRAIMLYRDQPYLDRMAKKALTACRSQFEANRLSSSSGDSTAVENPADKENDSDGDESDVATEPTSDNAENGQVAVDAVPKETLTIDTNIKTPSLAGAAEPVTSISVSEVANEEPSQTLGTKCAVCSVNVQQPCWFCVHCFDRGVDFFICNSCESQMLLKCVSCEQTYRQPTWYYGSKEEDNFMCNKCNAKRIAPPEIVKNEQHTYLHALVTCKEKHSEESEVTSTSTEEKIATLEEKVGVLDGKIERLEEYMVRVEKTLAMLLAKLDGYVPPPDQPASAVNGLDHVK